MNFSIEKENLRELLESLKLNLNDFDSIKKILKRDPNYVELGIFSAMWSEHCSYKSSKAFLKEFPTKASYVIQGPGENAGIIDIGKNNLGEDLAVVFKMESHNHPSFIEPHAGAATGVGGIIRDIFTMGADPIALMNSIRFGDILDPKVRNKHKELLKGVVGGIGYYGNCMGIPTIGGEVEFNASFNENILVNVFALGIVKHEDIFYGVASGIGNSIIYVGSKTGRDGLGGAVMSSHFFDDNSKSLRPTVQIGDPFTQKLLLQACLEIFKQNLIIGIQDMGAAGLTSSSFEMALRSNSGIIMHLDKVPTREDGMNPYELMLSESQERMLLCAKKGSEEKIIEIFKKYELDAEIIGYVTDNDNVELYWHGELCADINVKDIINNAPSVNHTIKRPAYLDSTKEIDLLYETNANDKRKLENKFGIKYEINIFKEMLQSIDLNDKSYVYDQFDSTIKANTIKGPGMGDGSIISLKNYHSKKALCISAKCNPTYCYLNPRIGASLGVVQAGRNVAISGAKPLAITDCLNFGSPLNSSVMYQFKNCCKGIAFACEKLNMPVISGNVSLYNETIKDDIFRPIFPTPNIVAVGVLEDEQLAIGSHFVKEDSEIFLLGGLDKNSFAGSLFQKIIGCKISGDLEKIDFEKELRLWSLIEILVKEKIILSAKDIGKGGIAIAIAKMSIIGKIGVKTLKNQNLKNSLFSESQGSIICEVSKNKSNLIYEISKQNNIECKSIGYTTKKINNSQKNNIEIDSIILDLEEAISIFYNSFKENIHK